MDWGLTPNSLIQPSPGKILPSSASTQFNSISTSIEAELVLFPFDPATTHPPAGKVSIETGDESNQKGLIQDHLGTTSS